MVGTTGTNRLKNRLEGDLCEAHVVGSRVLAVGIGAGRASLPLAERGCAVTLVGASPAMLDEARQLAGDVPIDLRRGDLEHVPADDEAFDSLLSLDCLTHVSNWREILSAWASTVRPGGRLIFSVQSLDHFRVARAAPAGEDAALGSDLESARLPVAARDLVTEADRSGLAVVDIVPYGAFEAQGYVDPVFSIANKRWWRRLLSWLATDDRLFDFALFLEQELGARLPTAVAGRYVAVLERRDDPEHNRAWLLARDELNTRLAGSISPETLAPCLRMSTAEFTSRLNGHVRASLRNFRFFEGLCQGLALSGVEIDVASFLEADMLARLDDWSQCRRLDREVTAQARDWLAVPGADDSVRLRGVSLGDALEYYLVEDLLTRYHGLFTGVRS